VVSCHDPVGIAYLKSFLKNLLIERFCFLTALSTLVLASETLSSTALTNSSAFTKCGDKSAGLGVSAFFTGAFGAAVFFAGVFFAELFLLFVFLDLLLSDIHKTLVDVAGVVVDVPILFNA